MRKKGMINVEAIRIAKVQLATAGAALAAEMSVFLPALWPNHRQSMETPDGVFEESTIIRSAPHYPLSAGVTVPDWSDLGTAYDFGEEEGDKVSNFQLWLFSRRGVDWLADYFGFDPVSAFVPFGARGDRSFEDGKFPRDQWKAGSFDADAWSAGRIGVANGALEILNELDRWNSENVVLTPRSWLMTKFVEGELVDAPGTRDTTFATVPELLEDVSAGYASFPAYIRVSEFLSPSDPTWTAAQLSFAMARARYLDLFGQLSGAGFAQDFFDRCFSVWRTGSQTHRRDQNEP